MRHMSPEELIDVAEGTGLEASAPHLSNCVVCRQQLAELRANGPSVLDAYQRNVRLKLYRQAKQVIMEDPK